MLRKESKAVPYGNGPVPQQEEFGSGEPTLADVYQFFVERFDRQLKSCFDRWDRKLDEMAEEWRSMDQRVASLEHDARQPRLVMVADAQANTKTRERTEGAAQAVQAIHIGPSPKTNSTSFGVKVPLFLVGMTFWSRTALRRPNRVSHPWRYAQQQPPVTYFPPAKSLQ